MLGHVHVGIQNRQKSCFSIENVPFVFVSGQPSVFLGFTRDASFPAMAAAPHLAASHLDAKDHGPRRDGIRLSSQVVGGLG